MTGASNVRTAQTQARTFTQAWPEIADAVAKAFRMDHEEAEWLENKRIAKLIGAIPFLAGCDQPARTAVTHVSTYLLSIKDTKPFFDAEPTDDFDILGRLRLIMNFRGGDPRIIDKGMCLLALNMLEDYRRDAHIDEVYGKYNPVASGAFDYEATRADLLKRIEAADCHEMDDIFNSDIGPESFWGRG